MYLPCGFPKYQNIELIHMSACHTTCPWENPLFINELEQMSTGFAVDWRLFQFSGQDWVFPGKWKTTHTPCLESRDKQKTTQTYSF